MDFNIEDNMIIRTSYDKFCVRLAVLENKLSLNDILIHKNLEFCTLVTLELT